MQRSVEQRSVEQRGLPCTIVPPNILAFPTIGSKWRGLLSPQMSEKVCTSYIVRQGERKSICDGSIARTVVIIALHTWKAGASLADISAVSFRSPMLLEGYDDGFWNNHGRKTVWSQQRSKNARRNRTWGDEKYKIHLLRKGVCNFSKCSNVLSILQRSRNIEYSSDAAHIMTWLCGLKFPGQDSWGHRLKSQLRQFTIESCWQLLVYHAITVTHNS